jgi:hypothetical protein
MRSAALVQLFRKKNSRQKVERCEPGLTIGAFVNADIMALVPERISSEELYISGDRGTTSEPLGEG